MTDTTEVQQAAPQTKTVPSAPVKRIKLPAPKKVLSRCLQRLEKIVQAAENGTQELSQARLTELILTQAKIALALHRDAVSRETALAREAKRALKSAAKDVAAQTPEPDPDVVRMVGDWQ